MADKILDCSNIPDEAFECIKDGLELHRFNALVGGKSYFGCVIKEDMKHLTKYFKYTDKKTLIKGGILGAGAVWAGTKVKKLWDEVKRFENPHSY